MMSEYSFIRGRKVLESQGVMMDAFMENELGYYDRKDSPFLQEYKKPRYQIYFDVLRFCTSVNRPIFTDITIPNDNYSGEIVVEVEEFQNFRLPVSD
jgi:hypothetical protein